MFNFIQKLLKSGVHKRELGALRNPVDIRDIRVSTIQGSSQGAIPEKYITDISMIPVQNQLSHGSCVGQAEGTIIAYFDYLENKNTDVSRRFIYAKAKQIDGIPDLQGTYPRVAGSVIHNVGVPKTSFVPDDNVMPYSDYLKIIETNALKTDAYTRRANYAAPNVDKNSFKQAIVDFKLVSFSIFIDWNAFVSTGKIKKPNPANVVGLHRLVAYGYDGNTCFARNSWGTQWGMSGDLEFNLDEYAGLIVDPLVYTDIPNEILEEAKKMPYTFTRDLTVGMYGIDVKKLQEFLNSTNFPVAKTGAGSKGNETDYFGMLTQQALAKFQLANGIKPAVGYFGAKTRAFINKPAYTLTALEQAIIAVESQGDLYAIGDITLTDKAYGCMQIRQPACDDVNKALGLNIKSQEMLGNINLSVFIFREYQKLYPNTTDEEKAKAWNGGGNWKKIYKKPGYETYSNNIDKYWNEVKKHL